VPSASTSSPEIRTARKISHPNLLPLDIAEIDGRHFLSMDYVDGEDLASRLLICRRPCTAT
jgi:serine/threonine protein kinase